MPHAINVNVNVILNVKKYKCSSSNTRRPSILYRLVGIGFEKVIRVG